MELAGNMYLAFNLLYELLYYLCKICMNRDFKMHTHLVLNIAQAVSRRLPTAAARVQTWVWSCGILWWRWGRLSPRT
jgi:hypothetical protein